jgi:hypothetical protein
MAYEQGAGVGQAPTLPARIPTDMMALIAMLQTQHTDGIRA